MYTHDTPGRFSCEQLEIFAKADAMFGMSFPYMSEIHPSAARHSFSLFGQVLAHAARTPLRALARRKAPAGPVLAPR
ncbi:hypothetical protein K9U39_00345 [Rhodoblastus acidophilus]|uniref:Uncharacterized protein n=1 Tax=Candidatus Rhodoblastus alkanivorans TaxID=2954117 RepID=A0ABS9Z355_9HYPH|nr:hypothetical protein [Candidatus Rhodoblastus alkanivorans]MCI4677374.1 hypothetical protein [Candidatus Rhodoblastus alkanivorans]MCI4682109.1 hypothetical protein [Candidatus Rhodoblastus alkanivorans]MDI4639411.1 hypothetical protein [Rhodoblastus acidophilus]